MFARTLPGTDSLSCLCLWGLRGCKAHDSSPPSRPKTQAPLDQEHSQLPPVCILELYLMDLGGWGGDPREPHWHLSTAQIQMAAQLSQYLPSDGQFRALQDSMKPSAGGHWRT